MAFPIIAGIRYIASAPRALHRRAAQAGHCSLLQDHVSLEDARSTIHDSSYHNQSDDTSRPFLNTCNHQPAAEVADAAVGELVDGWYGWDDAP